MRLNVIGIRAMTDVTDIVRLEATALALLSFGLGIVEVASILVLDWACRSPELTATFLANMDEKKYDADAESTSAIEVYRQLSESKQWRSFWKGPVRLNLLRAAATMQVDDLKQFGEAMACGPRVRVTKLIKTLSSWKHLGPYLTFSMVRCVAAALHVKIRDASRAAASMSDHTQHLADLVGFPYLRRHLQTHCDVHPCDGLLGFYLCETAKLLKFNSILHDLKDYRGNRAALTSDLTGDAVRFFLRDLRDLAAVPVAGGEETALQNTVLPDVTRVGHTTTDTLRRWRDVASGAL